MKGSDSVVRPLRISACRRWCRRCWEVWMATSPDWQSLYVQIGRLLETANAINKCSFIDLRKPTPQAMEQEILACACGQCCLLVKHIV